MASISNSASCAPGANITLRIARILTVKSVAGIFVITEEASSVFTNFEDLTFLEIHVWFIILMLLVDLFHDVSDMASLISHEASNDEDAEEAEARFSNDSAGNSRVISPNDPSSALSDGNNFAEEEERDHSHSLERLIELKFVSGDVFWSSSLDFFRRWWFWWTVVLSMSAMVASFMLWWREVSHHVGIVSGIQLCPEGSTYTEGTDGHQSV